MVPTVSPASQIAERSVQDRNAGVVFVDEHAPSARLASAASDWSLTMNMP